MSKTKYGIIDMEKQTLDSINNNIMDNIDSLKQQNENHQNTINTLETQLKEYENMDKHTMKEEDFLTIFEIKFVVVMDDIKYRFIEILINSAVLYPVLIIRQLNLL